MIIIFHTDASGFFLLSHAPCFLIVVGCFAVSLCKARHMQAYNSYHTDIRFESWMIALGMENLQWGAAPSNGLWFFRVMHLKNSMLFNTFYGEMVRLILFTRSKCSSENKEVSVRINHSPASVARAVPRLPKSIAQRSRHSIRMLSSTNGLFFLFCFVFILFLFILFYFLKKQSWTSINLK